ncbi:MAG: tetratricopeptide repeat protein [Cytophagales bacterium]|nr:tetratricopeptide repeat protein [Rhizobacter sp.]
MIRLAASLLCLLLTACASTPAPPPPNLFNDALFTAASQPINADSIFALSDTMKRYVEVDIAPQLRQRGLNKGLLDALYTKQQLKLEYDAERTRTAAEAFDARAGNCLSLVIMTAAFAKHLGLQVTYHSVYTDETWTRNNDTYFASGHVNLTLGRRWMDPASRDSAPTWTIDFLPPEDRRGQRSREISEDTVVAMYMNNRAAESLATGELDAAYAWARAAVTHAPGFLSAYNTLGVIYLRRGDAAAAQRVLAHVLQQDPSSTVPMSNMVRTLAVLGRADESAALARTLARLDPEPPYHFFDLGQVALRSGDVAAARSWFAKEVARAPYQHEFHFWLAVAEYKLGDIAGARRQLTLALSTSSTRRNQQLYAAKLDHLKQTGMQ